jgi:sentrin-specific protease 1
VIVKIIPQQNNSSDCGMFACQFSEYLSRRANNTFAQADMPYFRNRMIYEIVKKDLLHP